MLCPAYNVDGSKTGGIDGHRGATGPNGSWSTTMVERVGLVTTQEKQCLLCCICII